MKTGLLLIVGVSFSTVLACAQGGALPQEGTGGAATTAAATTSNGAGGDDTTSSTTTTTSGTGGEGGTLPPCSEDPCKLVEPQCGCSASEMCSVSGIGRSCIPKGTVAWGDTCGGDEQCVPGNLCLTIAPPSGNFCAKYCAADTDCEAPGGICFYTLNDGNGDPIPDVQLCTENCDPISNSGCTVASTACKIASETGGLLRTFSICQPSGAATQNALCPVGNECAPGFGCFLTPVATCLKWCVVGQLGCPGGTTCGNLVNGNGDPLELNGVAYGACQ